MTKKDAAKPTLDVKDCPECGLSISFIPTAASQFQKRMPVDAKPKKVVLIDGRMVDGYTPHWATCTNPKRFKRNRLRSSLG